MIRIAVILLTFFISVPVSFAEGKDPEATGDVLGDFRYRSCWCKVQGENRCRYRNIRERCAEYSWCKEPRRTPPKTEPEHLRKAEAKCWLRWHRERL
jgi:hypothetical protein